MGAGVVIPFPQKEPPATHASANDAPAERETEQAWADGYAVLGTMSPPSGFTLQRWQSTVDAAGWFLDRWADEAVRCGWTELDVFGCDDAAPTTRRDMMGLVLLLDGCDIASLDESGADLVTAGGARQRFYRRPMPLGTIRLWELYQPAPSRVKDFLARLVEAEPGGVRAAI
jgi:hypothetical protein